MRQVTDSGKGAIPLIYAPTADDVSLEDKGAMDMYPETNDFFYIDREEKEYRKR